MRCEEYQDAQYSKIFSDESDRYNTFNSVKIKKALSFFENHENSKILDIGCGDGTFSKIIGDSTKAKIFGLDISQSCVDSANEKGIIAKKMDIDGAKLPFMDETFGAVFCGDTIEHIFDTDKLIKEVHRILKPNGYIVISVPNVTAWYNRGLALLGFLPAWIEPTSGEYRGTPFSNMGCGHVRAFNKRVLVHFLEDRGFDIESIKGAHIVADKEFSKTKRALWNSVDSLFSRFPGLSTFIVVKARKLK
ncbi:MAG: class I SAM-dependent methyltransferase [Nanoarchaeota archaeon]|nr:class I SAM-dependent methyltransferase [Nanoarchaeota archaeon]MBU2519766.1 class I SAM-dependent methyltransferase [Nanoarchaeota archaeon]